MSVFDYKKSRTLIVSGCFIEIESECLAYD